MSQKILGIDLGTSSIGISLRNPDVNGSIKEQLEYFSVDVFKSGIGKDSSGEYSFAANRSAKRRSRRLYDTRRRRLWATLRLLIENDLCPLSIDSLNIWMKYDKSRGGYSHQYPVDDKPFEDWIKLDFNNDGIPDFVTPYHLRKYLIENQLDMENKEDRYKLGRAMYHIAQRRGFKSSKGDKANVEADNNPNNFLEGDGEIPLSEALKDSELKTNQKLLEYMKQYDCKTTACAFADMIDKGFRIRASEYRAVRLDYKKEIKAIFDFQEQLSPDSLLYIRLISEKKNEGTIFYKKSLASQKGNVGKCTLEKDKSRCPISHPVYEEFRALSFINNIRYKLSPESEWLNLTVEQIRDIYESLFISRVKKNFKFEEIRNYLEKHLSISLNEKNNTINYKDTVTVSACPVTSRLIKLLGKDWRTIKIEGNKQRCNNSKHNQSYHTVSYTAEDIWNFCFNADEQEELEAFASERLNWDDIRTKNLIKLWDEIQQGYAMLSKKAMQNINKFLWHGLMYSDAVLLAKVPDLLCRHGHCMSDLEINDLIQNYTCKIKCKTNEQKQYANITNALISTYKALDYKERFADRDYEYLIQESDINDIKQKCKEHFGDKRWGELSDEKRLLITQNVADLYQSFFFDKNRDYVKIPKLSDAIFEFIKQICNKVTDADKQKLYHHSMISVYTPQKSKTNDVTLLLGSPNIGSIKNPVAIRTLNMLRKKINQMIENHIIDPDDTRVVIETTRRKDDILDDANVRRAFTHYQTELHNEREAIENIISKYYPNRGTQEDIDKAKYIIEQYELKDWQQVYSNNKGNKKDKFDATFNRYILKYEQWLKQGCQCIYTGEIINITNLFDDNATDLEHTIPRSLSFDSSDMNLTVCDSYYNREIKKNRIPTQLENYYKDATINGKKYTAILPRLKKWEEKVEHLEDMVNLWKRKSTEATTKEQKDFCIVNKHEWQMELNYWKNKLDRFTRTDIPDGFRNSQLVDTGVITRHSIAYLKSIFNNVVAQKGSVTADFRKILGLQSIEEKKDRNKHSHHAIDATILTVIPIAGLREEILKLYYQREEALQLHHNDEAKLYDGRLNEKIKQLNIGNGISSINEFIEQEILINHRSNDRAMQNAKRNLRIRGRKVYIIGSDGASTPKFSNGDSIRLELSAAGNLGAILLPDTDDKDNFIKENGHYKYTKNKGGQYQYTMVQRVELKSFKKIEELEKIIDPIVRQSIKTTISNYAQTEPDKSFSSIMSSEIWIRDNQGKGKEIKVNKNGKRLAPIRHVRCKVAAGRGFLKYDSAIHLRKQKYVSDKPLVNIENRDHKRFVYAQNTGNYLCLVYEGINKGKLHREFTFLTNYEIAMLKHDIKHEDGIEISTYEQLVSIISQEYGIKRRSFVVRNKNIECNLAAIIRSGYRVLKWNESPDELQDLDKAELLKRLYVVIKFNTTGSNLVYIQKHLSADTEQIEKVTSNNFNFMIEHRDFEIKLTEQGDTIIFND